MLVIHTYTQQGLRFAISYCTRLGSIDIIRAVIFRSILLFPGIEEPTTVKLTKCTIYMRQSLTRNGL